MPEHKRQPHSIVMDVIPLLRAERERQEISQHELARRMNTTAPYVSNLEAGRVGVSIDKLVDWASYLGLEVALRLVGPDDRE